MDSDDIYDQISIKVTKKSKSKVTKLKPTITVVPKRIPIVSDLEYDTTITPGLLSSKVDAMNDKLDGRGISIPAPVPITIQVPIPARNLDDKFSIASLQSVTNDMKQYQMLNGVILRSSIVPFAGQLLANFENGQLSRYFKSWFGQKYLGPLTTFRLYLYAVRFNHDRYVSDETSLQLLKILYVIFITKQVKSTTTGSEPSQVMSVTKLSIPPFIFKRLGLPFPSN
jgi:hypothetical protein